MDSKRYRRYFVILDGTEEGFESRQSKKPKGYAKIETRNGKGVLNYYVQNLKYFEEAEWIYRGYLIGTKKGKPIYVQNGMVVIDKDGKGELNWKFDVENVDGRGNGFDDFNVIAIIAENANKGAIEDINAPLAGFIDKQKVEWKHVFKDQPQEGQKKAEKQFGENIEERFIQQEEDTERSSFQVSETIQEKEEIKQQVKPEQEVEDIDQKAEVHLMETAGEEKTELKAYLTEIVGEEKTEPKVHLSEKVEEEKIKLETHPTKTAEEKKTKAEMDSLEMAEEERPEELPEENRELMDAVQQHQAVEKDSEETAREAFETAEEHPYEKKESEQEEHDQAFAAAGYTEERMESKQEAESQQEYKQEFTQETAIPNYNSQYFKMVCGYIQNVLKYYPKAEPFEKNIEGCNWWKISCNHQTLYRHFMPFYGYLNHMNGYPYMNYMASCSDLIYKYQHYIFGIKTDTEGEIVHYLYGVPGRFLLCEQPDQGMTGFVYWHPIQDKTPERGEYGYWILHIDPKTGNVAMPLKPTPPPHY